jgi:hypothetical protein
MMTKFLLEAAINYGLPIETDETRQNEKDETKKTPTKAATAASASTMDIDKE